MTDKINNAPVAAEVPSIDTPEFRAMLISHRMMARGDNLQASIATIIAHIDAHIARSLPAPVAPVAGQAGLANLARYHHNEHSKDMHDDPCGEFYKVEDVQALLATLAAPVAATEQATIDTPEFRRLMCAQQVTEEACSSDSSDANRDAANEAWDALINHINNVKLAPLATPADAGAGEGLTIKTWRERLTAGYEECDEREARDAEVVELREVLARLSTSPAPVTVEPADRDATRDQAQKGGE